MILQLKTIIIILFVQIVSTAIAQTTVKALRVKETKPCLSAYVLSSQEQITGQAFQQDALVSYKGYQYTVYYNLARNVCISRRKLPSGDWKEVIIPFKNSDDDAHDVISVGICHNDGTIHLAYDHHNTPLQYCRSAIGLANNPESMSWSVSNFGANTSQLETGVTVPDVTYPRFINKPDGNLLFECRYKLSGDGDSYLREYDGNTNKWSLVGRYVQGMDSNPNACAYINRMDYDINGRLHVSWCWRDDYGGGSNHDIFYGYSDDHGRTWKDTNGTTVATTEKINPTNSRTSGTCMRQGISSLKIATIPFNKGYINQETQATDSKGRVHIVNSYMVDGTDSNWASSRTKAVLHHLFRDTDGTWRHNLIKRNGSNVNSYCRVQIAIDKFDNAYVVANGAEVFAATSANNYSDWGLLSNTDIGRFCSEPQIDQKLISEGILSFVYLGRDKKVSVIDYLLDNPKTPNGTGLHADYFSDDNFKNLSSTAENILPGNSLPSGIKSVRFSGTLETVFGESHTLYINTTVSTLIYINGAKVLETGPVSGLTSFSFTVPAINSHKNNIIIESKATTSDQISLQWSGNRTAKTEIPVSCLYSSKMESTDITSIKETIVLKNSSRIYAKNQILYLSNLPNASIVKVCDLAGRNYIAERTIENDFSLQLPKGLYLVYIESGLERDVSKVVVR